MKKTMKQRLLFLLFGIIGSNGFSQNVPPKEIPLQAQEQHTCSRGIPLATHFSPNNNKAAINCASTMAAWSAYNGNALVQQLKSATDYDSCLRSLFSFDNTYGPSLFSNSNIDAVAREMYAISISHNGTLSSGMLGLTTYLHAATYHDFFQASVTLDANAKTQYGYAVESFANNSHLWDLTSDALAILDEYMILCDYEGVRHKPFAINVMKSAIRKLTIDDNWLTIVNDNQLMQKYVTAYNRMFFLLFRGIQPIDVQFESALNNDTAFFGLLSNLAKDIQIKNNTTLVLLTDNAVGEMARMMTSTVLKPKVEPHLASIANGLSRLTPNWYRIIKAINEGGNCSSYNLCENMTNVRTEIDNMLFPNTFTFDDGKLTVKTPLSYNTVLPLYYASKQVQSQVFRFLETDQAVANDPNVNLNMVLYGSLANYQDWQSLLNGLDSNNGGMYIENGATFYTYERTKAESTFTLEELFRHEYVHYLQGRYMVNGSWGSSPIYANNRLVWFEEGMAEHFAGSTDSDGVTIRESQGSAIKNEGASQYMNVSQILSADYNNGFKFYRYGNMLWSYWFKNDMTTAKEIVNLVRADNISGYDAKINQLKSNSGLQTAYTNYLNNVVINPTNWWSVNTPWKDDKVLTVGTPSDILTEFTALTGKTGTASTEATNSLRRFSITGTLTGGNFNTSLDNLIKQLNTSATINNFKYLTAYYKTVSGNTATYIISGPLRNASIPDTATPLFSTETTATISGGTIKFKNESTGYIKAYNWSFPGGTPSTSTLAEPSVVYNTPGTYNVQLTVTGKNNTNSTATKTNYITIYQKPNVNYCTASVGYDYTNIANVSFANINNNSQGFPLNGYSDFTNILGETTVGQIYILKVTPELSWPENNINVWIDWNQNGLFTDPGEKVLSQAGATISTNVTIPANAITGVTRMRVRYSYGKTSDPCGLDNYMGEVEDYSILVKSNGQTTTIATPTNLTATANNTSLQVVLSWTDNANNETAYTVERATGTGTYAAIANLAANANSYTNTGLATGNTYSYRVRATTSTANSDYSNVAIATLTTNTPANCTAQGNNQYEYIKTVSIGSFTNTSGADANGYGNYTSQTITLTPNATATINLTPGFLSSAYTESWSVWIDYNKNNLFDASELVVTNLSSNGAVSKSFAVPSTATGTTRMRIVMKYNTAPTSACGNIGDGEVEDYTVDFSGIQQNTLATPTNIGNSGIYGTGFYASWTQVSAATNYEVQLFQSNAWTTVGTSNTYYLWVPKQGTTTSYRFRVRATNATSTSDWSNFVDLSLTGTAKISETTETTSITMYPNPAVDRVYFNTNQEDTKNTTITIYDSFGKLIATIKNQNSYSVEKLAKGLYFVKIATGTFEETKKLFIE
jgi:hypothetical protein